MSTEQRATIKLPLAKVVEAEPALARLAKKELPLKFALHVARLYRKVAVEQRAFEEQRNALVQRLGTPVNGASGPWRVAAEHVPVFLKEIDEAVAVEVTLDCAPLQYGDLQALENIQLSAEDLLLLSPLFADTPEGLGDLSHVGVKT